MLSLKVYHLKTIVIRKIILNVKLRHAPKPKPKLVLSFGFDYG